MCPARASVRAVTRLMIGGWISPDPASAPVEVRRAMAILGSDGRAMGQVAAVVIEGAGPAVTHLLLCRLAPEPEYRLAPVSLIERVDAAAVHLRIPGHEVMTLPRRATD